MSSNRSKSISFPFKIEKTTIPRPSYSKGGSWGPKETIRFVVFICYFDYLFDGTYNKRPIRFMKTRTVKQCRSHHQKLFDNGKKKVSQMLKQFQKMIGRQSFKFWIRFYTEEMKEIHKRIFDRFQGKQNNDIFDQQNQRQLILNQKSQDMANERSLVKISSSLGKFDINQSPYFQENQIKIQDKENYGLWDEKSIFFNCNGFQNQMKMNEAYFSNNFAQKREFQQTGPTSTEYQRENDENQNQNRCLYSINPLLQNQNFCPQMEIKMEMGMNMNIIQNPFFNLQQQILIENSFVNQQIWKRQNQIERIKAVRQCNHNLQLWLQSVLKLEEICKYEHK